MFWQPLIGQIVLERLDLIIEPTTRKVIPNPRSPETPMIEIFMATSPNKRVSGYATFGCSDQNHALSEMADKRRG